jgi:hypothetical protein
MYPVSVQHAMKSASSYQTCPVTHDYFTISSTPATFADLLNTEFYSIEKNARVPFGPEPHI